MNACLTALLLAGALGSPQARPYTVILQSGGQLRLISEPVFAEGAAQAVTTDGRRFVLPLSLVDRAATRAANLQGRPPSAPRKVWTEADLARLRGRGVSVVGGAWTPDDPPAAGAPAAAPKDPAADAAGEQQWRARAQSLDAQAAGLESRIARLDQLDSQWESLVLGTGEYREQAARELSAIRKERTQAESDLQQARGDRARLDDEARQARVPPGWLR